MNTLQNKAMEYLTNGEGTTDLRMRAVRELAAIGFFDTAVEESASRVVLREYAESQSYGCREGVNKFLNAVDKGNKKTVRILLDVTCDGDYATIDSIASAVEDLACTEGGAKPSKVVWLDYTFIQGQPYTTDYGTPHGSYIANRTDDADGTLLANAKDGY